MAKNMNKILAFIPARQGSKRLPGKNSKLLAGKPLIAWTIQAALEAELAMEVMVSTDSPQIAELAQSFGAEVPFLRPPALAADHSSTFEALQHMLQGLQQVGRDYDAVVLLQPTSPLRQAWHIEQSVQMLTQASVKSVVSVSPLEHPLHWSMALPANHCLDDFVAQQAQTLKYRSQDAAKHYRLNGAVYCATTPDLLKHQRFYMPQGTYAYVMDKRYAVDIDEQDDFDYAEFLLTRQLAAQH